jgi:pSer/pThr/pTyr-binding forkhead associated (FHA) protein
MALVEQELEGEIGLVTNDLGPGDTDKLSSNGEQPPVAQSVRLELLIRGTGRRLSAQLQDELRIGRYDPSRRSQPDVDLTAERGMEAGVSRMHAMFQLTDQGVMVVDLGSKNGTLLNSYRLPPDMPYPVRDGDELSFGKLLVTIRLA